MSTAWYKSRVVPKLVQQWKHNKKSNNKIAVEVWDTTCIVTNFEAANCQVLINPANPNLTGVSKFPYFPRGGPEPTVSPNKDPHHIMGYVSQWGGMDVGNGMMFSTNVVDGLVHQLGGWKLAYDLSSSGSGSSSSSTSCPEGQAVLSGPGGGSELAELYSHIVHTVSPFYNDGQSKTEKDLVLADCYRNSLQLICKTKTIVTPHNQAGKTGNNSSIRVACPLLGAGCRGFPTDEAIQVASKTLFSAVVVVDGDDDDDGDADDYSTPTNTTSANSAATTTATITIAFGIPDGETREALIHALDDEWAKQ